MPIYRRFLAFLTAIANYDILRVILRGEGQLSTVFFSSQLILLLYQSFGCGVEADSQYFLERLMSQKEYSLVVGTLRSTIGGFITTPLSLAEPPPNERKYILHVLLSSGNDSKSTI